MKLSTAYSLRAFFAVLTIVIYFIAWRPLRETITQQIVAPQVPKNRQTAYNAKVEGVHLSIAFSWHRRAKIIQYRPQAGFFFLISLLVLILWRARWKWYLVLSGLHIFAIIITGALMFRALGGWLYGFVVVDFIVRYMVPALSLGLAAWVAAGRQTLANEWLPYKPAKR